MRSGRRLALPTLALLMVAAGPGGAQERPLTIVTLGTSLTARGGWQPALEAEIARCVGRPVAVPIVARSGETSRWGLGQVEAVLAHRPDVVLVEFATNDAALQRWMSLDESVRAMRAILERLLARTPRPRVIVMGMNPVLRLRGAVRPWLDDYVAAHRDLAQALGAEFVDHGPAWRALDRRALDRAIPDGVHPDPAMAARVMVPTLAARLAGPDCRQAVPPP